MARALADKELAALYARLARPPSLFLRAWAAVTRVLVEATFWLGKGIGWAWLALLALFARLGNDAVRYFVLVSAILGLVLLFLGVSAVGGYTERYLGMDVWSVFPTWLVFGSMAGVVSTAFLLPGPLVSYLEAFTGARERARACLAARPPSLPGGPSLCRHCGAALSVMQGMRGARCAYCATDNLLIVNEGEALRSQDSEVWRWRQVKEAIAEERHVRRYALHEAWSHGGQRAVLVPLVAAILGAGIQLFFPAEFPSGWSKHRGLPRPLIQPGCAPFDDGCEPARADLLFALARGEVAELVEIRQGQASSSSALSACHPSGGCVATSDPAEGFPRRLRFQAEASGWFRVSGAGAPANWRLTVTGP